VNDEDWDIIVSFRLKADADRQLAKWLESERMAGRSPDPSQIRRDIGMSADGRTIYRYAYPKSKRAGGEGSVDRN